MEIAITAAFIIGYLGIAFEHLLRINKAAIALLTGVVCWTLYIFAQPDKELVTHQLTEHLGEISGILFFLLGAMTLVELIDANDGFQIITDRIRTRSIVRLVWTVGLLTFFLSAALDNLTTTIVIMTMLRKIVAGRDLRLTLAGVTIIAANAGGAWSPLGDVTTTMLWIGGQITTFKIVLGVFLPSVVCLFVPLLFITLRTSGTFEPVEVAEDPDTTPDHLRMFIFVLGILIFLFVPIFKTVTHLPPFMAMLLGLSIMWVTTELIQHGREDEEKDIYTIVHALQKIDSPSILFFLGILICIAALQSTGQLTHVAMFLSERIGNETVIVAALGLLSAVVDNVPLVAAAQGMYSLEQYPRDSYFWQFLAYATGTGGSALIIGSAAGVAAMGIEKIDFFWYIKRVTWLALLGYFAGAIVFMVQHYLVPAAS
jgi:Na+/H+ antiporter NhaD/arsenite permease-like protein